MKKAAVYVRRSKEDPGSHSIEQQTERGIAFAHENGYECDPQEDVYVDNGVSGAKSWHNRPAASHLLDQLTHYDAVVFWKLDRLARSMYVFVDTFAQFGEADTDLLFWGDRQYDTTSAGGRAFMQITMVMAELERGLAVERTQGAHRHLADKGAWRGGHTPYGFEPAFDPDRGVKVLVADDEEAEVVRELADRVIDGESANSLAAELNARDVPTAQGGQWSSATILKLLRRPLLRGFSRFKGEVWMGEDGSPLQTHEPLISAERWEQLKEALGTPTERKAPSTSLLRGFIYCAECGGGMGRSSTSYQCASYKDHDSTCPGVAIGIPGIENLVAAKVTGVLTHPDAIEHIFRVQQARSEEAEARTKARQERAEALRLRVANFEESIATAESPDAVARLSRLYEDALTELRSLEEEGREEAATGWQSAQARKEALRAVTEWDSLTLEEQRNLISQVIERVEVAKSDGRGGSIETRRRRAIERVNIVLRDDWTSLDRGQDVIAQEAEDWILEHGWDERSMSELATTRASGTT